jgi:membrane protein YdbS with pleckstrin-like domain
VRNWVLSILRVPPEPHPPEGSPGSIRVFRAGRNYYRFRVLLWAVANFAAALGLSVGYLSTRRLVSRLPPGWQLFWIGLELLALSFFLLALVITFLEQRWNFELRWYMVTDRSLRIRSGIWSTQELTTTFANIQEIRVSAGPLQKLMGLADVEVHSAGGGSSGPHGSSGGHVAKFEGLDNANEIRDFLSDSLRHYRDSGLGEAHQGPTGNVAAAQAILDEVRLLKAAAGAL